jgi:hypothetical protein
MSAKARFIKMLIAAKAVKSEKGKLVTINQAKADAVKAEFERIISTGKKTGNWPKGWAKNKTAKKSGVMPKGWATAKGEKTPQTTPFEKATPKPKATPKAKPREAEKNINTYSQRIELYKKTAKSSDNSDTFVTFANTKGGRKLKADLLKYYNTSNGNALGVRFFNEINGKPAAKKPTQTVEKKAVVKIASVNKTAPKSFYNDFEKKIKRVFEGDLKNPIGQNLEALNYYGSTDALEIYGIEERKKFDKWFNSRVFYYRNKTKTAAAKKKAVVKIASVNKTPYKRKIVEVNATQKQALEDVLNLKKYEKVGAMFGGMVYSKWKNDPNLEIEKDSLGNMQSTVFEKNNFTLVENNGKYDDYYSLTPFGKDFINSVNGRLASLKNISTGSDLFERTAKLAKPKGAYKTKRAAKPKAKQKVKTLIQKPKQGAKAFNVIYSEALEVNKNKKYNGYGFYIPSDAAKATKHYNKAMLLHFFKNLDFNDSLKMDSFKAYVKDNFLESDLKELAQNNNVNIYRKRIDKIIVELSKKSNLK